jgi:hypothetical protein
MISHSHRDANSACEDGDRVTYEPFKDIETRRTENDQTYQSPN